MTVETKPLAELTRRAIELLSRELGAADMIRFVNQFTIGYGDYTAERESLLGPMTLDEIISQIKGAAPLIDEDQAVLLVELGEPRHSGLEHVRLGVGVLADEDVQLLEAEHALRLEPERHRAPVEEQFQPAGILAAEARQVIIPELIDRDQQH